MMFTPNPPSISTSLMKFLLTWTWITAIWWLIAIVAHASSGWTSWINLTSLKMYHLMSNTIFNSCPKLITYLISKTWILMSFKISSKIFSSDIICGVNWIGCLLIASWLTNYDRLAQFEWNGMFKLTNVCDIKSLPYNSLIIWTKESHDYSYVC
jgi:hypothetical protein